MLANHPELLLSSNKIIAIIMLIILLDIFLLLLLERMLGEHEVVELEVAVVLSTPLAVSAMSLHLLQPVTSQPSSTSTSQTSSTSTSHAASTSTSQPASHTLLSIS